MRKVCFVGALLITFIFSGNAEGKSTLTGNPRAGKTQIVAADGSSLTKSVYPGHWTKPYNIVWTSPGLKAYNSMPIGGGDIALNVWTEKDALLFYIGSSDSRDENQNLLKIGRIRLTLSPNPFIKNFRQELDLESNSVRISGSAGDGRTVALHVWVDGFNKVVHVEGVASAPVTATVAAECWRNEQARFEGNSVVWLRRNDPAIDVRARVINKQSIEKIADLVSDPLKNLTWGGRISGEGMVVDGTGNGIEEGIPFRSYSLKTRTLTKTLDIRIPLRIAQDSSLEQWRKEVAGLDAATSKTIRADRARTRKWWQEFWDRSHIVINPDKNDPTDLPWQVGRNYQLFRAMLGANSNGKFPTLFNGGPFLCGPNPDERMWGGTYFMSQNQRLVYWPLIKSGDTDLLRVGLDFYAGHAKLQYARARLIWGIDGAIFPELMNIFGLDNTPDIDGHSIQVHLKYHYTTAIEFAFMMLEYCRYTGQDCSQYLPVAEGIIHYFDQYYRAENKKLTGNELDSAGHLVLEPVCGLEQFIDARNSIDVITGLMALTDQVLELPDKALTEKRKEFYRAFRSSIPSVSTRMIRGHLSLAPAEKWGWIANTDEFPAMYPVFPFGIYGLEKPDLELARDTWWYGYQKLRDKRNFCWYQSLIFTARLGLTHEAGEFAVNKFLNLDTHDPRMPKRTWYPAFWDNTGYDQLPDMDHGGSAMVGLQEMLLQGVGRKILIFPAWPKEWDVDFKLHAPYQTTVEASLRNGKITKLVVTPAIRSADVVDMSGVIPPPKPIKDLQVETNSLNYGKPATSSSVFKISPDGLVGGNQATVASKVFMKDFDPKGAVDGITNTRWAPVAGSREGWLEVDLGEEKEVGCSLIQELMDALRIQKFVIEYKQGDAWKEAFAGTKIGEEAVFDFPPVRARFFRLRIIKSEPEPTIIEFHLFPPRQNH